MEFSSTVEFAEVARLMRRTAGALGLVAPSFRCPPALVGVDRSIRRRSPGRRAHDADPVVSVRLRGRQREAVIADMIEGIIVSNDLRAPAADRVRNELWAAVSAANDAPARGAA